MSSFSSSLHWNTSNNQISKYIDALKNNPFFAELKDDIENHNKKQITNYFNKNYAQWISKLIETGVLNDRWIEIIQRQCSTDILLTSFSKEIESNVPYGDIQSFNKYFTEKYISKETGSDNIYPNLIDFEPSVLKLVTTTGVSYINSNIDFKYLYDKFEPPKKILESIENKTDCCIYDKSVINTVIGCKTGNLPVKGFFEKTNQGNFCNCATLNVCIDRQKTANVKVSSNGRLQLTGVPNLTIGEKIVKIVCDLLCSIEDDPDTNKKVCNDKSLLKMQDYKTVMINTCYNLGVADKGYSLNREYLYNILLNRYNITAIYDSEGYPGVRVHYYYNPITVGTVNDGKCVCSPCCTGNISDNKSTCSKISIAIFQSGSVIIAGGCQDIIPIQSAYNFVNNIFRTILNDVIKLTTSKKIKKTKDTKVIHYIPSKNISNYSLHQKLVSLNIN